MSPISIRAAALDDIPAILAIEHNAPSASHWNAEQYKGRVQSRIEDACFFVAEYEGKLAGFICARIVAGEWEIENVVVTEEFRRRGVAAELMRSLLARWEQAAGSVMLLEVRESNAAARALYAKSGFAEVGRRPRYYRESVEDAILYARRRT
jgi:[ribosomal protein S18]-alanine N-acetyltransferase